MCLLVASCLGIFSFCAPGSAHKTGLGQDNVAELVAWSHEMVG